MTLLCQVRQIPILLLILAVGARALIPDGHTVCFRPCGDITLASAHGPHGCDHDDEPCTDPASSAHEGHDHSTAPTASQEVRCVSATHPSCTDIAAGELVVDRGRSPDLTLNLEFDVLWSPPTRGNTVGSTAFVRRQASPIPRNRGPSPDSYSLPLRI